ncbi:MAG: hypothetical protein P8J43_07315, partial [Pirellulales bacterium]|nr:hypothetical protein [Pirellulales bacterium]
MTTATKTILSRHFNNLLCDTQNKVFTRHADAQVAYHAETEAPSASRIIAPRLSKAAIRISC